MCHAYNMSNNRHKDIDVYIGDLHAPFHSDYCLRELYDFLRDNKDRIRTVCQIGDVYDFLSWSRWPSTANPYTPKKEYEIAYDVISEMWQTIGNICKRARLLQLTGNHDVRPLKRLADACPELSPFVDFTKPFEFKGVELWDYADGPLAMEGYLIHHGFLHKPLAHAANLHHNVVIGHLHKLWAQYYKVGTRTFWELCCGFMGDIKSPAFSYAIQRKYAKYQCGFGYVDTMGPHTVLIEVPEGEK